MDIHALGIYWTLLCVSSWSYALIVIMTRRNMHCQFRGHTLAVDPGTVYILIENFSQLVLFLIQGCSW